MTKWALLLAYAARETGSLWAGRIAKVIVPAIVFAECCSWYAVISTSYIGNAMEESTWALTWVLVAVALALMLSRFSGALRVATVASLFGIGVYVLFMVQHDVPMYVTRWQADVASGKAVLGLFDGFDQLAHRWVVTHDIAEWKTEIPWMTLYFSFAVWASIGLCHLPLRSDQLAKYLKNPPLRPGDRPVELAVGVGQLGPAVKSREPGAEQPLQVKWGDGPGVWEVARRGLRLDGVLEQPTGRHVLGPRSGLVRQRLRRAADRQPALRQLRHRLCLRSRLRCGRVLPEILRNHDVRPERGLRRQRVRR